MPYGLMLHSGAITPAMHAAGRDFQAAFTIACFDSMPRVNLNLMARSPSPAHDVYNFSDRQLAARERVARALDALGGHGSPAGSCVWHVVGMQTSVCEWALRQGWGGRSVRQERAQGILVAALGMLAKHYGIRDDGQRRCARDTLRTALTSQHSRMTFVSRINGLQTKCMHRSVSN